MILTFAILNTAKKDAVMQSLYKQLQDSLYYFIFLAL